MKANLKKLPEIEPIKYEMTRKKIIANYFLFSVFFLPVGILVFIRSHLKLKVLNTKLEQINFRLLIIKDEIEYKGAKREHQELKSAERIKQKSKYPIPDTKEKILDFIDLLNKDASESFIFIQGHINSFYDFLRLLLTKDLNYLDNFIQSYSTFYFTVVRKFDKNPEIKKLANELPYIKYNKKTKLSVFINYLILSFLPLAAIVFYLLFLKIKKLAKEIESINKTVELIREEIQKDKTTELNTDFKSFYTFISEKNIKDINKQDIQKAIIHIQKESILSNEYLKQQTSSVYGHLKLLLSKDLNELEPIFNFINRIAYLIKREYNTETDIIDDIKTYRDLNFRTYKMTYLKITANYFLLSFIIVPVGFIIYYFSKQKIKKLTEKIELIEKTSDKILLKYFQ